MSENSQESEITKMNSELLGVLEELKELKKKEQKNQVAKKEALVFLEKAEKVISLAEQGKLQITEEQKRTIVQTLLKIRGLFKL